MTSSAESAATVAMPAAKWPSVTPAALDELAKGRAEAINIVQWLARIADSFVVAGSTEERIALDFRRDDLALVTRTFENGLALELRLPMLEMQFVEHGRRSPHIFDPEEHSPAEVEAWLLVELLHRGVERSKFSKKLPYSIPHLLVGDAEKHSPQACEKGLADLATWLSNAAAVLDEVGEVSRGDAPRLVCWPQSLDLILADRRSAKPRIGFSPGDAQSPEPFFYRAAGGTAQAADKRQRLAAGGLLAGADPARTVMDFMNALGG